MPTTIERAHGIGRRFGHGACVMCGDDNPCSLRIAFEPDETGSVEAGFTPKAHLQGFEGFLHGGVTAALLDSAMTNCLFHCGVRAMTADLRVRYPHPVPIGGELRVKAWMTGAHVPLYYMKAEITAGERILAWAQATFCETGRDQSLTGACESPAQNAG